MKLINISRIGIVLLILMLIFSSSPAKSQLRDDSPVSEENIYDNVKAQTDIGPRYPGSSGAEEFKNWIELQISDPFTIERQNFEYNGVTCTNFIIQHKDAKSLPPYIIAAHWDSRRIANNDPDPTKRTEPVPGANDGASGVAAILELMKLYHESYAAKIGYLLFDCEDQGSGGMDNWNWIVGSQYFADQMTSKEVKNMESFILLDMIGDPDLNLPYERNSDDKLQKAVWDEADNLGYGDIFIDQNGYSLIDDHIPFKNKGIDTLDIIDFDASTWHTVSDDLEHVSATSIAIVTDVVYSYLHKVLFTGYTTTSAGSVITIPTSEEASFNAIPIVLMFPILVYFRKKR